MLTKLTLENFKSFKQAELPLGPFTVLVGTNASGKSNIRDAFRFLHGIARGYTLADIFGEVWTEGGAPQWEGIRGGIKEVAYSGIGTFCLTTDFQYRIKKQETQDIPSLPNEAVIEIKQHFEKKEGKYSVTVETIDLSPKLEAEILITQNGFPYVYRAEKKSDNSDEIDVVFQNSSIETYPNSQSILSRIIGQLNEKIDFKIQGNAIRACINFESMRFFEFYPEAMKRPSLPGQTTLGSRGENLSSVLYAIWNDENKRDTLLQWIRELTPMDVQELTFPSDPAGRILVTLKENGREISAYSASDGTLRFLALIAALLGPEPARFYFIEELENGIHPSRLHLLIQLIEQTVAEGNIQIVATTHSPQLLSLLNEKSRQDAMLVYRLPEQKDSRIKRIMDIPNVGELLSRHDLSRLHSTGWFENVMSFLQLQAENSE